MRTCLPTDRVAHTYACAGYTHFFYTMQPQPPYRMLATSAEFCLAAEQDAADCESVQFISGLALEASTDGDANQSSLLLSYGINDCEAKIARLTMAAVWRMLRPLAGEAGPCMPGTSD